MFAARASVPAVSDRRLISLAALGAGVMLLGACAAVEDAAWKPAPRHGGGPMVINGAQLMMSTNYVGDSYFAVTNLTDQPKCYWIRVNEHGTGWQYLPPREPGRKLTLGAERVVARCYAGPGQRCFNTWSFNARDLPPSGNCADLATAPAATPAPPSGVAPEFAKGWRGLKWGATLPEFRARFPKSSKDSAGWWITGEGIEEFAGLWVDVRYGFNRHDRLGLVQFYTRKLDAGVVRNTLVERFGPPQVKGAVSTWSFERGNVELKTTFKDGVLTLLDVPLAAD